MNKKRQTRARTTRVRPLQDLSARRVAAKMRAGYTLQRCFVKSWSTSGDA